MKILFVMMSDSIHSARWINNIINEDWEIHIFPTENFVGLNPLLKGKNVKFHRSKLAQYLINKHKSKKTTVTKFSQNSPISKDVPNPVLLRAIFKKLFPKYRIKKLSNVISKIKPDIIHSLHIQEAGYLTLKAKEVLEKKGVKFPKWIVTNYGSEIDLFGNIDYNKNRIRKVLESCDYYSSECKRDLQYASDFGFKGKFLSVIPNSGGIDFKKIDLLKSGIKPSKRENIMVKGYQGWAGRALVALRAIERCMDIVKNYKIILYSVDSNEVMIKAELMEKKYGISIKIAGNEASHEDILKYHSLSRISIGLSITDAISTSLIEAMSMGSFPIQSNTSCAEEWAVDGKNFIYVPAEDPEIVESAIRRALTDDNLVDKAEELNYDLLLDLFEESKIREKIVIQYRKIFNDLVKENKKIKD
ncbi:MAG: glycosyltransferase [Actinomycetota bacterium]|nr:glycosyltransferase [Actinomycetota bacterium]